MLADARPQVRKKPEAYSLEYVEDVFGPRTTQMSCRSFAAVEWHYSDRHLKAVRQAGFALVDGWFNS
jgi:hypothetical protein